jgi:ubiquinone/menaquinone biosynthesis C-methylase UbiE
MLQRFYDAGAEGYDLLFGRVPRHFAGSLLRAARLTSGSSVLDIATGTGIVAEAIATTVGPSGKLVAADISPAMLTKAKARLADRSNVTLEIADGQALRFADAEFDAVVCSLGLMLFPDPARGLTEFRRVLRDGCRAAVSVETTAEHSLTTRINAAIGRQVRSRAAAAASYYSLGGPDRLRALFAEVGFSDVEVFDESHRFHFPSFDAYFEPIELGAGSVGAEFTSLSDELRETVREEIRQELESPSARGGPIEVEVRVLFGSGLK